MGCPFLLQGNFLTWISYPGLPHGRQMLSPLSHQGCPPNILKSQLLQEVVLGLKSRMSLCIFLAGYMLQLYRFHRQMTAFERHTPIPSSQKHVSLQFQSCVNAFLGHNVFSVNVDFCIPFCTDPLKLYCQRNSHQEVASRLAMLKKGKMPPRAFCQAGDYKYSKFVSNICCFHFRA